MPDATTHTVTTPTVYVTLELTVEEAQALTGLLGAQQDYRTDDRVEVKANNLLGGIYSVTSDALERIDVSPFWGNAFRRVDFSVSRY